MALGALLLLLPVVLSIHNLDEYAGYQELAGADPAGLPARFRTRRVFAWAATLLTVAVAILCLLTYLHDGPLLRSICAIAIFALGWNALGHCALSVARRSLLPGTRSACAIVLPYSGCAILVMHASLGMSSGTLLGYAALGILMLPLAAASFLPIGYSLSRL